MAVDLPVYVVHFAAPDWLALSVDALVQSSHPIELTVIDNGPGRVELDDHPAVRLVHTASNVGFSGAANLAVSDWLAGEAPFCVVASHDVLPGAEVFATMVRHATLNPEFGILAPELTNNFVSEGRTAVGALDRRRMVSGGLMLLNRACISEIGQFDERFHSYGEDEDLCARARRAGWSVGTVRGLVVETLGTRDERRRTIFGAAARVVLRDDERGWRGAGSAVGAGGRRALQQVVRRQYGAALRTVQGTVIGVGRVVRRRLGIGRSGTSPDGPGQMPAG